MSLSRADLEKVWQVNWHVQNDATFSSVEEARNAPSLQYDVGAVEWHELE